MTENQKKTNKQNQRAVSYNWLISLPLKELGYYTYQISDAAKSKS